MGWLAALSVHACSFLCYFTRSLFCKYSSARVHSLDSFRRFGRPRARTPRQPRMLTMHVMMSHTPPAPFELRGHACGAWRSSGPVFL